MIDWPLQINLGLSRNKRRLEFVLQINYLSYLLNLILIY